MQPRIHTDGDGRVLDILGNLLLEKAGSEDLGGGAAVFVQTVMPRNGPPAHFHRHTDEFFYVLEGELEAWVGDRHVKLRPGMSVIPTIQTLTVASAAPLDRERPVMPRDLPKLIDIVGRHDIEVVEPAT